MNDKMVAMWLTVALVFQVAAIFTAFIYVFAKSDNQMHILLKTGFALSVFGLVVQIVRSIHYLDVGYYPIDRYVPIWLSKDIGIMVLIYFYAFLYKKGET